MSTLDSPQPTPPAWTTPPTAPGPVQPAPRRSTWPNAFGIIAIIYASLGLLGGGCGILITSGLVQFPFNPELPATPAWQTVWTIGIAVVAAVLEVALLVGGIRLINRRASGIGLCRKWAVAYIIMSLVSIPVNVIIQRDAMMETQGLHPAMASNQAFMMATLLFGAIIAIVWTFTLPILMLVWFSRPKIKAEVAQWAAGDA